MKIINEFKAFAMRGNVIDLAVGIIIGGGFGKIVSSLVNDIIMPPIGYLVGGIDFKEYSIMLPKILDKNAVPIHYGLFLNNLLDFAIVAFAIFLLIKLLNKFKKEDSIKPKEELSKEVLLLQEIRDLLKAK